MWASAHTEMNLMWRVFGLSITVGAALISYFLQLTKPIQPPFDVLHIIFAPPLIYVPCAYIVNGMRGEIFMFGIYI